MGRIGILRHGSLSASIGLPVYSLPTEKPVWRNHREHRRTAPAVLSEEKQIKKDEKSKRAVVFSRSYFSATRLGVPQP
jgi:hypothetical protein